WKLAAPVQGEVDSGKAFRLADDLGRLEAVEYVTENAKPEDLDTAYGLAKPALTVKLTFTDAKKPAQTLLVGKQRPGKDEFFAKLDGSPGVFVLKKDVQNQLEQDSLAYRPLDVWKLAGDDVAEVRVRKGEQEYRLKRDGQNWKVVSPFEAVAVA